MSTYTHVITLYIDIKANTKADSTRKFGEFDFKFVDPDTLERCNYTFEQYDILEYPEDEEQEPFDPTRSFESVKEAVEYCRGYCNPSARAEEVAHQSIDRGEYGFCRDLLAHL